MATFEVMPLRKQVDEGQGLSTMIHTDGVANGTRLYWQITGQGITAGDISSGGLSGEGTVISDARGRGMLSLSHTVASDLLTEGRETLEIQLFSDPARATLVARGSVTINDTSLSPQSSTSFASATLAPTPTYKLTTSATSLQEGKQLTTTVATSNVRSGTKLYWQIAGTGINNADFSKGTLTGVGTVDRQGKFSVAHTLKNDLTTEGPETLQFRLFTDPGLSAAAQVGSTSVLIVDTSISAKAPTYTLTPSLASVNEGQALTTAVTTTNVTDGTILYYQISGTNIEPTDFNVGVIAGQILVQAGKASISHILSNDLKTEGEEVMRIQLFADKPGGTPLGAAVQVTVNDTSKSPQSTTEIFRPEFTPFAIRKWASPVPVPALKRPDYVGEQTDIWGTKFAPQPKPGGQPALYTDVDPTQKSYGGIAPEFYDRTIAGTDVPYYSSGQPTSWYSQREAANMQIVVDGADSTISTQIFGYDATMPGTTFKTRVGQPVVVRHWNDLPSVPGVPAELLQRESVHLHGGHNPAHTDGYASFVINQGMYRDYYYANTVPMGTDGHPDMSEAPSTMWYHDHGEDLTDFNVIKGLAGFWLSFDDRELDLIKNHVIPGWWKSTAEWNEQEFMENNSNYDIPLAISDRRFNADGSFHYDGFPIGQDTDGYLGDVMLVNGKSYPYMQVEPTQYRLRMLGASTGRIWHLSIQDANGVMQNHLRIGNDTWLMPNAIAMTDFTLSPAQRADVVMDFSGYAPGTELFLVNTAEQHKGTGPQSDLQGIGTTGFSERIMKIVVGEKGATTPSSSVAVGTPLRENIPILESEISNRRTFEFGRSNGLWLINQTHFDSDYVNNIMPVGVAEQWTLKNGSGGWWHPIHMHLESHQVVSLEGRAPGPDYFPEKQFKSDTTLLGPNTTAVVNMKFRTFQGPFVFHCHTLQHEDSMMMFNFDPYIPSENPANYKEGDPIPAERNHTPFPFAHAHHPGEPTLAVPTLPNQQTSQPLSSSISIPETTTTTGDNGGPSTLSPTLLSQFSFLAYGTGAQDTLKAKPQASYLNGRDGNDYLLGNDGNDMLVAGSGDDIIRGRAGHDLIAGEMGSDILTGGRGRDGFYYISADPGSVDTIHDFKPGEDFISLHHAIRQSNGADATWTYVGARSFLGGKGEVRFSDGLLQCDLDGDFQSDINVRLLGIGSFDANWLTVPQAPATA